MLVTFESAATSMPAWRARMTSGTVDMPTRCAPMVAAMRISAGVSKCGPQNQAYTPSWRVMDCFLAIACNRSRMAGL